MKSRKISEATRWLIIQRTRAKREREREEKSYIEIEPGVFIKKWGSET